MLIVNIVCGIIAILLLIGSFYGPNPYNISIEHFLNTGCRQVVCLILLVIGFLIYGGIFWW